jgi:hypothetical protein
MSLILNAVGLVLNLAGGITLYFYGAPQREYWPDREGGYMSLSTEELQTGSKLLAKDRLISQWGIRALCTGFILQFAALWCQ